VTNLNADKVEGKDLGALDIQSVNRVGPLPLQETFTSNGGKLLILNSGFRNPASRGIPERSA